MDGFVGVRSGSVLNDIFAFDLEEDVVGSERAHGLLDVIDQGERARDGWDWCGWNVGARIWLL